MPKMTKKILLLTLMAFAMTLWPSAATSLSAQQSPTDQLLQPQAFNQTGIHALKQLDPSLTGQGVNFALISRSFTYIDGEPQNDYRPYTNHNCLSQNHLNFQDREIPAPATSPHSTAVCSILLGDDPNAFCPNIGTFHYSGVAPQAKADVYEFWHFITNNIFPASPPDADIIAASFGSQFEDWWTRGIEAMAQHHGLIVVAAIGNGTKGYDPPLYPAAAANVIAVGVVDSVNSENLATNLANFSLASPDHSSSGPTEDGRCKPDLVAPGNCLAADENEPNRYEPTGNFSSFAAPIVAGTAGLLVQKAKHDPNLIEAVSTEAGNCVIKAILLNSATKLPYWHKGNLQKDDDHIVPLDYVQGAGMLNAIGAYELLTAGTQKPGRCQTSGWDNNLLAQNEFAENIYEITIHDPNEKLITATLSWNRHYQNTYPFEPNQHEDADLRLELWAFDPNNPDNAYLLDYSDSSVDNIEHIHVPADANYTNYLIVVSSGDANEPDRLPQPQRYGIAWNVSEKQKTKGITYYDLNADGIVDQSDFTILLNNWLTSLKNPQSNPPGDINNDGLIDTKDLQIIMDHKDGRTAWYQQQDTHE